MTIENTLQFIEQLKNANSTKTELRTYTSFINVLEDVKVRNLSDTEILDIENEISTLDIKENVTDRKKLKKKLNKFIAFIKKKLSLISEGQYTGLGMALGIVFGMSLGSTMGIVFSKDNGLVLGMNFGMILGMCIGLVIGAVMDSKARKEGKVLNT